MINKFPTVFVVCLTLTAAAGRSYCPTRSFTPAGRNTARRRLRRYSAGTRQPPRTRRELFADWVTGEQQHLLARAFVNRLFLELTGRGFVDKPDGLTLGTAVRHEPLLELLASEFVKHDFDQKWLMRSIVLSDGN